MIDQAAELGRFKFRRDLGLLFNPRSGQYHRLENDVAVAMYELAARGESTDAIVRQIASEYDASEDVVRSDFIEFMSTISSDDAQSCDWYGVDKGFRDPLGFPLRLEVELTALCNWGCGFCYNVWKIDPSMTEEEARVASRALPSKHIPKESAFQLLRECERNGCYVIRYSGGETMLHPDFMEIMRFGGALGLFQVVFTNGHYLTAAKARELAAANVRTVLISLHGGPKTHAELAAHDKAYEVATRAIDHALEAGIEVVVESTLVKDNLGQIVDIMNDVYARGVREFRVMRYVGTGRMDERYSVPIEVIEPLMLQIRERVQGDLTGMRIGWPCGQKFCTSKEDLPLADSDPTLAVRFEQLTGHCEAGLVWGSVSYDGQLRNCPHSNVYFGSVEEGMADAWKALTAAVAAVVAPRASCSGCSVGAVCRGGCHLSHFLASPVLPVEAQRRVGAPGR